MDAECKLADAFTDSLACVCGHVRVVHVYLHVHKCVHICTAVCGHGRVPEPSLSLDVNRERVCVHSQTRSRKRSRPHISAALPARKIFS